MANLRRKIEENSADPQFLLTEVGVGYRMVEGDEDAYASAAEGLSVHIWITNYPR